VSTQQVSFPRSFVAAMGALGSLSLRAVLPKLLEGDYDIKILISAMFSRHIGGNRALNR
jgi:hypothetical protein